MAVQGNWNFFTKDQFKWGADMVGYSLGLVGILVGLVSAWLTRIVNPIFGNNKSIYYGLTCYTVGLILFAFATKGWMMFAILVPYCLGGIAGPALQSVMAAHVQKNEQGALQGALTSLMSITTFLGPLIMNNLYTYFTSHKAPVYFPGVSFLLGAFIMIIAGLTAYFFLSREQKLHPA